MKLCVLDIGGTFIKGAVMDEKGNILKRMKAESDCSGQEALLRSLDELILPLSDSVEGIAVSMPGRIDSENGIAQTGGAFAFIRDFPIVSILEARYHKPVTVENDGKAAACAESWMGALKDVGSGLVFIFGTGIGGGIILNHKVVKGSHFAAGELSLCMMRHDLTGFRENNMIAHTVSTRGLLETYREAAGLKEAVDGIAFFECVHAGEETAVTVFRDFCRMTANYLFNLQVILDVECIAIGGGISDQPILLKTLNEELDAVYRTDFPLPCVRPRLVKCRFGNDANLIGALKVFLDSGKLQILHHCKTENNMIIS